MHGARKQRAWVRSLPHGRQARLGLPVFSKNEYHLIKLRSKIHFNLYRRIDGRRYGFKKEITSGQRGETWAWIRQVWCLDRKRIVSTTIPTCLYVTCLFTVGQIKKSWTGGDLTGPDSERVPIQSCWPTKCGRSAAARLPQFHSSERIKITQSAQWWLRRVM